MYEIGVRTIVTYMYHKSRDVACLKSRCCFRTIHYPGTWKQASPPPREHSRTPFLSLRTRSLARSDSSSKKCCSCTCVNTERYTCGDESEFACVDPDADCADDDDITSGNVGCIQTFIGDSICDEKNNIAACGAFVCQGGTAVGAKRILGCTYFATVGPIPYRSPPSFSPGSLARL